MVIDIALGIVLAVVIFVSIPFWIWLAGIVLILAMATCVKIWECRYYILFASVAIGVIFAASKP